jgi:hypothetical protein
LNGSHIIAGTARIIIFMSFVDIAPCQDPRALEAPLLYTLSYRKTIIQDSTLANPAYLAPWLEIQSFPRHATHEATPVLKSSSSPGNLRSAYKIVFEKIAKNTNFGKYPTLSLLCNALCGARLFF